MLKKAYLEITNVCNLACSFCHGTKREPKFISVTEFENAARQIRPFVEYLYLHVLGEPLLHPELDQLLSIARSLGFKVIITTNGTLLRECTQVLIDSDVLYKVSVSLHSFEANDAGIDFASYLTECFDFCDSASSKGIISVMRLWNIGGLSERNEQILSKMALHFKTPQNEWVKTHSGFRIRDRLYLEWGRKFEWPDSEAEVLGSSHTCYGMRDHFGVLSDGTVVPCCLDADGAINLGNIFETPLCEILSSERAVALKRSLENRCVSEELCKRCGYAVMMNF